MENKSNMSFGGIGPRIALISLPYVALCIAVSVKYGDFLKMDFLKGNLFNLAGYTWLAIGIIFYLATARLFFSKFPKGKLITEGTYSLCRNPIYASFIVFFIPALALILKSGLILSIDLVLYLNFRIAIHGEYIVLKARFGEEYLRYEKQVNELLPLPRLRKKTSN
jgi:protein-S-isoprenylcysteine O-methyltransferase Ste14